jgi:hypothetical protein
VLNVLHYIPIPPLDPLHIHGWDTAAKTDNQNASQVSRWDEEPGAKVLAYKAYGGKLDNCEDISKLREMIKSSLGITTFPTIAAPIPIEEGGKKDDPPLCSLVKGILPEKAQELLDKASNATPNPPNPRLTPRPEVHLDPRVDGPFRPIHAAPLPLHHDP